MVAHVRQDLQAALSAGSSSCEMALGIDERIAGGSDRCGSADSLLLRTFLHLFPVDEPDCGTWGHTDSVVGVGGIVRAIPRVPIIIYGKRVESCFVWNGCMARSQH